jgi:diaminohydroxyphosphoribosylaminopyrimidine deaminase/5-amino-6-(5-phosphoribosylamino)uracil reductase
MSVADIPFMKQALELARQGLGRVWPNPSVGCVIVKDGAVIGAARTDDGGRPHAETQALAIAGEGAKGGAAYVSLEPCNHEGKTPPCTKALIESGVARVVIACTDPDPRVQGKGIAALLKAGLIVETGVLQKEALALNAGFFLRVTKNRPLVTLKVAMSADEKIAGGEKRWITGEQSRGHTHIERSQHDAIMVGINTVLADDPLLTTRLDGVDHRSVRIVLDSTLKLPGTAKLIQSVNQAPLWIIHDEKPDGMQLIRLRQLGANLILVPGMQITDILATLAGQGLTRLLVEGGAQVHRSFIDADLCDRLLVYQAPHTIGADGVSAFGGLNLADIVTEKALKRQETLVLGEDLLEIYALNP